MQASDLLPSEPNRAVRRRPLPRRVAGAGYWFLRGCTRRAWMAMVTAVRVVRNLTHRLLNRSDYKRWIDLRNYEPCWEGRTEKIARLIPPGSRVIEFGAGRRQLERLLDPTCTYVPSDLVDRGPRTFLCDLNRRPLPDLKRLSVDTAILGGVLEYLHDIESLAKWLGQHVHLCVASYACAPQSTAIGPRLRDALDRFYYGYMNSYREEEVVEIFRRAGFRCIGRDPWGSQRVFLFVPQRSHR